jgi:hypothetical protein
MHCSISHPCRLICTLRVNRQVIAGERETRSQYRGANGVFEKVATPGVGKYLSLERTMPRENHLLN